ncbi:hypothetical protein RZE82_03185 [Mollicutes bacterium LVI A0039]|nr:hypothetical protein RZE82_03185 [Mollicutes bacterium LVI A0039]
MKLLDKFIDEDITKLKFTNQELKVFHFITQNIDNIGKITAKEIAEECFCTTTTVNRFCKKYGVSGFSDFSAIIAYESKQLDDVIVKDKKFDSDFLGKIDKSRVLFLFGSGASLFTAHVLERYLLRRGYTVILLEDRYFLKEIMREQIMLFSNSGLTAPALDLAYTAKKMGMTTYAVTAQGSELDKLCEHTLTFPNYIDKISSYDHESQLKMHSTLIKVMK